MASVPGSSEVIPKGKLLGTTKRGLILIGGLAVLVAATSLATLYFDQSYQNSHPTTPKVSATAAKSAQDLAFSQSLAAAETDLSAKKYTDAITALKGFLSGNPSASSSNRYAAELNLASAYMATKDYTNALASYQAAEKISGTAKLPEALGIANAAEALNNKTLALQYLDKAKALTTDPAQLNTINLQISDINTATQ